MKILLLAEAKSPHTIKWVNALSSNCEAISLLSFRNADPTLFPKNVRINSLQHEYTKHQAEPSKLSYLKLLKLLKKEIKDFRPDILHAYYASSYGLIGALSGFKPYVISVWGSDVFEFPNKSLFHKTILKYNLKCANQIQSTSEIMAIETKKYTHTEIVTIPFGIDIQIFTPKKNESKAIVIGTIKWLEPIYGIHFLIEAFDLVCLQKPETDLRLLIVGEGSQRQNLEALVKEKGLSDRVEFVGGVQASETPKYHQRISIFAALSLQESFGVAVLEAAACGVPAVVTNVGGLPEVVEDNKTGLVVDSANPRQAANAFLKLIEDEELRAAMGRNARKRVEDNYNWSQNILQQLEVYQKLKL